MDDIMEDHRKKISACTHDRVLWFEICGMLGMLPKFGMYLDNKVCRTHFMVIRVG